MPRPTRLVIGLLLIAAVSGLMIYAAQPKNDALPRTVWMALGLVMLLAALQYIYYNLTKKV